MALGINQCPTCGQSLVLPPTFVAAGYGFCQTCKKAVQLRPTPTGPKKRPATQPKSLQTVRDENNVTIVWPWYCLDSILLAIFASVVVAASIVLAAVRQPTLALMSPNEWALAGALLIVCPLSSYIAMAMCLNQTIIRATRQELTVEIFGLPWPGARHFKRHEIAQLYVGFQDYTETSEGGPDQYALKAVLVDGSRRSIISWLPAKAEARFIEQQIEEFWGIEDRRVDGELYECPDTA